MPFPCLIRHLSKQSCQYLFLYISHRDDLVFVDPQQISNNYIPPLQCAETETDHGQCLVRFPDEQRCNRCTLSGLFGRFNVLYKSVWQEGRWI